MKRFKLALSFLTILPVRLDPVMQPGDLGRSAVWFPLVGALLGALLCGARYGLALLFPEHLTAILIVALWAALTGGLHLDGLADCCDGLLASVPPQRRLEIMKDPRLGTFGGAGLLLHLLIKIGLLLSIPAPMTLAGIAPLLLAPALARWLILLVARQPMARPGGLGVEFSLGVTRSTFLLAAVIPLALAALSGWRGLLAVALAHLALWGVIRLARQRLGGVTGDVMGLTIELGESMALLAFAIQ